MYLRAFPYPTPLISHVSFFFFLLLSLSAAEMSSWGRVRRETHSIRDKLKVKYKELQMDSSLRLNCESYNEMFLSERLLRTYFSLSPEVRIRDTAGVVYIYT